MGKSDRNAIGPELGRTAPLCIRGATESVSKAEWLEKAESCTNVLSKRREIRQSWSYIGLIKKDYICQRFSATLHPT